MEEAEFYGVLSNFIGTENYYRHWSGLLIYTDGVKYLAENAGAYWLIDIVASWQKRARRDPLLREFQIWKLTVNGRRGVVKCLRDTDDPALSQDIPLTDFPLREITLYLENEVLMLPTER